MKTLYHILPLALLMTLLSQGCKENDIHEDDIDTSHDRKLSFGGPILNASFTVDELMDELVAEEVIDSGVVTKDENDMLFRSFETKVDLNWNSLVVLKDLTYSGSLAPSGQLAPLKASSVVGTSQKLKVNEPGTRYDHLSFKSGKIRIDITVPVGTTGTLEFTVPQFQKKSDGTVFKKIFNLGTTERTSTLGLGDYRSVFSQGADSSYIEVKVLANLNYTVPLPVSFDVVISEMEYEEIYGYFGQKTEEYKGVELDFNFFSEYDFENKVQFYDFQFQLESENFIGVPFKIQADSIWLSKGTSSESNWKMWITPNYMNIAAASTRTSINHFTANRTNSNIQEIGNKFPDKMVCNIKGVSNPDNTSATNFIKQERRIANTLKIKFPFWFKTSLYERADEVDFDFNDIIKDAEDEVDGIEELKIYMDFNNRFPFEIGLQLMAVDSNDALVLNLLPANQVIASSKPENDGKGNQAVNTRLVVSLNKSQINLMRSKNTKRLIIQTKAVTYNQGNEFVKLYGSSRLDLNVYLELKAQLPESFND